MSSEISPPTWSASEEAHPVVVPPIMGTPHPLTRRTAAIHGWEIEPRWTGELPDWQDCFAVTLRFADRQRVLRLLDTLFKACAARGFDLRHDPSGVHFGVSIFVDHHAIPLRLVELGDVVTHLSLETGKARGRKIWRDNPRRPLEKRLGEVLRYLRGHAAARIAERRYREEYQRKEAEFMRQRAELRAEIKQEREDYNRLIDHAENWRQAEIIRAYVAAFKTSVKRDGELDDYAGWIDWALDQADRLDPLRPSPPSVLDTPPDHYRELSLNESLNEEGKIEGA